jgi:hypothetical protein
MKIAVIAGSSRPKSQSSRVAVYVAHRARTIFPEIESPVIDLMSEQLPLWSYHFATHPSDMPTSDWNRIARTLEATNGVAHVPVPEDYVSGPNALGALYPAHELDELARLLDKTGNYRVLRRLVPRLPSPPLPLSAKRGKVQSPIEFGHKVFLAESARGLITQYDVLDGNPVDEQHVVISARVQLTARFFGEIAHANGLAAMFRFTPQPVRDN